MITDTSTQALEALASKLKLQGNVILHVIDKPEQNLSESFKAAIELLRSLAAERDALSLQVQTAIHDARRSALEQAAQAASRVASVLSYPASD